jgi:hypothetical protein
MTTRRMPGGAGRAAGMRGVACSLVLVLVAGCTSAPRVAEIAHEHALPARVELDSTPFHPQTEHACGPAALATLLGAAGAEVSPEVLAREVFLPGREGAVQPEMTAAVRARGFLPYAIAPDLDTVMSELAAGRPVLVLQKLGAGPWPSWHYAVAVGYDASDGRIVLRSGTERRQTLRAAAFDATWARAGYWGFVALPPGTLPTNPEVERYMEAAAGFEATGLVDEASRAYAVAAERWPDEPLPWLGVANVFALQKDWTAAERTYRRVLALDSRQAVAWNNRAEALRQLGCLSAAREALEQGAAAVAADDAMRPALARTLAEVEAGPHVVEPAACVAFEAH